MANTVQVTTLLNGPRNIVALVNLASDGATGDESNTVLIDRSAFGDESTEIVIDEIEGVIKGFTATLSFDATADLKFALLPDGVWFKHCWEKFGGVSSNKAGAGANGDVLLTTSGFSAAGDVGTFILRMRKM
jgi:hypothetical protein